MMPKRFYTKVRNRVFQRLYSPIRVFVFHHVSDVRNPLVCAEQDWTDSQVFYANLVKIQKEFVFVSLEDAIRLLNRNCPRKKKYAVLTTDDGLQTVLHVWPWLERHNIPLTCFVNAKYLDGVSYKALDETRIRKEGYQGDILPIIAQQYLNKEQLFLLNSPLLTISLHGYEHLDATQENPIEFVDNVHACQKILDQHPGYRPFFAYPWGKHNAETDKILREMGMVPVLVDGMMNYHGSMFIHRECIDGIVF